VRKELDAGAVDLVRADALDFLRKDAGIYDVVFLDPPFAAGYWPRLAPLLPPRLAPEGMVYHESAQAPDASSDWEVRKQGRAGNVFYQLLGRTQA
jgi:16S rRNA (guanine966-N2)-methyltransferase